MNLILFDLDDSLIAGDSESAWVDYLNNASLIKEKDFKEKMKNFTNNYQKGQLDTYAYSKFLLSPIKGMSLSEVDKLTKPFCEELLEIYKDNLTKDLLLKHNKDQCLVVSGTLSFLVKEISLSLGIETFFGTDPEVKNDIYTGGVKGNPNFGKEKIRRVKKWIKERKIDLNINIFAYSDSIYDFDLLNFSDNPTAINPDNKLRKICSERNWEIIERFNY